MMSAYAKAQSSGFHSLPHLKSIKSSLDELKGSDIIRSKGDYPALLRHDHSFWASSVFEDSSDAFDWVFRSYRIANLSVDTPQDSPPSSGQCDFFLPPASSLVHLSEEELTELSTLLNNAPIEQTVSEHYLQGVTEKLQTELCKVNATGGHIGTLKELLFIVRKAITAFAPYRSQAVSYDRHLFAVAFSKLSGSKRRQYATNYARDTLQLLSEFARHEIITYYSVKKRQVMAKEKETEVAAAAAAKVDKQINWQKVKVAQHQQHQQLCGYCHEAVHSIKLCPVLKNILCFQCFNYGHSSKKCPEAVVMHP